MKTKILPISILALIIIAVLGFFLFYWNNAKTIETHSENYNLILAQIEKGNNYIIGNNSDDLCFPYRYYQRGCYYGGKLKFYEGLLISTLSDTNLSHEEKWELCFKFAYPGSVAWCLRGNAENENEKQECIDFAGDNTYLTRICNLEDGKIIPQELGDAGPYDEETLVPYLKYSEFN
jgi:hypothetical protein